MLPRIEVTELIPADLGVTLQDQEETDGNVPGREVEILARLVKHVDPEAVFEIGTFDGRTSLNLAMNIRSTARIYTLDLPRDLLNQTKLCLAQSDRKYIQKPRPGIRFQQTAWENKIVQLLGDSATFDFSPYQAKIDFLFVDGSHSYDYVLNDTRQAFRMIRPGGMVVWHDYGTAGCCPWPGVAKALEELHASYPALKGMKHIAGTSLVVLPVSSTLPDLRPIRSPWHRKLLAKIRACKPDWLHLRPWLRQAG